MGLGGGCLEHNDSDSERGGRVGGGGTNVRWIII